MHTKESDYVSPALVALKAGNYASAIDQLQIASLDTPAATSDDPDDVARWTAHIKITRAQVWWVMMIAQRLDGRFDEADETLRLVGGYAAEPSISELLTDDLHEILLARAEENHDESTRQMLLR